MHLLVITLEFITQTQHTSGCTLGSNINILDILCIIFYTIFPKIESDIFYFGNFGISTKDRFSAERAFVKMVFLAEFVWLAS